MTIKYSRCKFPGCIGNVVRYSQVGLCNKHGEMRDFFVWCLDNVELKTAEKKTQSGIIIPK